MSAYYNEIDPKCAAWLRILINANLIAPGEVDERSIIDVTPDDLIGFKQCHFFAGIGGWSYALRLSGIDDDQPIWTASPPCQPFSTAGLQKGKLDERHLAPVLLSLVEAKHPSVLFGEQVSASISKGWLDDLFIHLEGEEYECASAVLPAASVGAPHQRNRLFFGAHRLAHPMRPERHRQSLSRSRQTVNPQSTWSPAQPSGPGYSDALANGDHQRLQGKWSDHDSNGWQKQNVRQAGLCDRTGFVETFTPDTYSNFLHWSDADWLRCYDGKFRAVEPGSFPLAHGLPARMGRLRGYGNAIVPQVASEFINAFFDAVSDKFSDKNFSFF